MDRVVAIEINKAKGIFGPKPMHSGFLIDPQFKPGQVFAEICEVRVSRQFI
jgi:hypothetical protein